MKSFLKSIFFTVYISLFSSSALGISSEWSEGDVSKVRLISPMTHNNNQDQLILGLEYEMEPGWKTYWQSPGDGGFPQTITWKESTNVKNINIQWPYPKEFQILGMNSIGYENEVIFPLEINIEDVNKNTLLDLKINYLICKDICIPGDARLFLDIPAGKGQTTDNYFLLEKAKSNLPEYDINLSYLNSFEVDALKNKETVVIKINTTSQKKFEIPKIFIHTPFGLPVNKSIIDYSLGFKSLTATFEFDKKLINEETFLIDVLIKDNNHNFGFIKNISLKEVGQFSLIQNSFFYFVLISLLGGLILNAMPCVFPVLSIKLMSVLNTDLKNTQVSFLVTSIGIISSFIILGLIFLLLQQLNITISWGMQFQQPYFLLIITSIIFFFMMNMFNQFNFSISRFINLPYLSKNQNNPYIKDFFNGFFATLMATPCSAPFIGTAITAAFTQSAFISINIFFFMGLGMSFPYLLIAVFPKLITFLPHSGKWMLYVKYILGFLLLATLIWLSNILLSFYNYYFLIIIFLLLLILTYRMRISFLSFITVLVLLILPFLPILHQNNTNEISEDWLDFYSVNINDLISDHNIVFVDITADWCATCQFNKINVLNTEEVNNLFIKNNVTLVRADWTKPNMQVNKFINQYDRFGIPFNAFFSKNYPKGILLSELLSKKDIEDAIKKIKAN